MKNGLLTILSIPTTKQRFSNVQALHEVLLKSPATRSAAKALERLALAPKKTFTWSAFMTSDVSKATVESRMVEIPRYLNAVLGNETLAAHPAVRSFLGLGAAEAAAF